VMHWLHYWFHRSASWITLGLYLYARSSSKC
jgi:hypothetical protein